MSYYPLLWMTSTTLQKLLYFRNCTHTPIHVYKYNIYSRKYFGSSPSCTGHVGGLPGGGLSSWLLFGSRFSSVFSAIPSFSLFLPLHSISLACSWRSFHLLHLAGSAQVDYCSNLASTSAIERQQPSRRRTLLRSSTTSSPNGSLASFPNSTSMA